MDCLSNWRWQATTTGVSVEVQEQGSRNMLGAMLSKQVNNRFKWEKRWRTMGEMRKCKSQPHLHVEQSLRLWKRRRKFCRRGEM